MRLIAPAFAVLLLAVLAPAAALADSLSSYNGEPMRELSHQVTVRIDDGVAYATVVRVITNVGDSADEAVLALALPDGAFATGLRVTWPGDAHEATLEDAQIASERFTELRAPGGEEAMRKAAILEWRSRTGLELSVHTVPVGEEVRVEYQLTLPLDYEDGHHTLEYRASAEQNLAPVELALDLPVPGARYRVAASQLELPEVSPLALATGTAVALGGQTLRLEVPARGIDVVTARLGSVALDDGRGFANLQLELASPLVPTPREPVLVFLLDASHSVGADLGVQLRLVETVLAQAPDARVEIVAYDRHARRLFGELRRARDLDADLLHALAPEPRNGSALDVAFAEALAVLEGEPGPKRIIAMTDTLLRPSWLNDNVLDLLHGAPQDTVVHLVNPFRSGAATRMRLDQHALSPLALAHGGVFLQLSGFAGDDAEPSELAALALELVRPTGLDHVRLEGIDPALFPWLPERLEEGEGVSDLVALDAAHSGPVVLRGELWSTPFERVFETSEDFSRATAGFVLSHGLYRELDDNGVRHVALAASAVSPLTSLLIVAEEGYSVRQSRLVSGGSSCGSYTGARCGGVSRGARRQRIVPDPALLLAAGVERCLVAHGVTDFSAALGTVELTLDTTRDEIVDVQTRVLRSDVEQAPALAACFTEVAWGTRLDGNYVLAAERFVLELPSLAMTSL